MTGRAQLWEERSKEERRERVGKEKGLFLPLPLRGGQRGQGKGGVLEPSRGESMCLPFLPLCLPLPLAFLPLALGRGSALWAPF